MLLDDIKNIESGRDQVKKFGLSVGGVLILLASVLYWYASPNALYLFIAGLLLMIPAWLFPLVLKPLQIAWMTVAVIIGWFMTRVILSVLYYVAFTIIGLSARIFGKQFLELKWDKNQKSYWNPRNKGDFDKLKYEKQF
ncbi:MAG: hypothetical protein H6696_17585 [Deferribacteres bacterium]|nr:hypothetical protein [candidate division KSB1 bacterium]MCB9503747.1 hypothetical protein [Deferribacteres bacterium]